MGIFGAKEKLGLVVSIYGYNGNIFPWMMLDKKSVYHTTGLIVDYGGKKYVVTTRTSLVSCNNICMYHKYYFGSEPVMQNNLEIAFQFIEQNIIILVSKNQTELLLNKSHILSECVNSDSITNGITCGFDITIKKFPIPSDTTKYNTIATNTIISNKSIKYNIDIYNLTYVGYGMYNDKYLPDNFLYEFSIKKTNLQGILGSVIYKETVPDALIGIIVKVVKGQIYVLPTRILAKIVSDFVNCANMSYGGFLEVKLDYEIDGDKMRIVSGSKLKTTKGNKMVKKNDIVDMVNGKKILVQNSQIFVEDDALKTNILLNVYFNLNLEYNSAMNITIIRKEKNIILPVLGSPIINIPMFTNQSYYYPKGIIPYVNICGIIIVELTHELIDILMTNKIQPNNEIFKMFFENDDYVIVTRILLIIDCENKQFVKKNSLPTLSKIIGSNKTNKIINFPFITMINSNPVSNLSDINNLSDTKMIICAGLKYDEQFDIIVFD